MKFVQRSVVYENESKLSFEQYHKVIQVVDDHNRLVDEIRPSELQEEYRRLTADEVQAYAERWINGSLRFHG